MANDLNERLDAAPEPEMRVAAPAPVAAGPAGISEPESRDEAPERTTAESSNETTSPSIRLVDNKDFKVFSYGGDEPQPGLRKNGEPHMSQEQEAINAIRRDITLIANGSSQITANRNLVSRQAGNDDAHTSVRGQQELQRQLAEQQRIAAWNNTLMVVGGVSMTQLQALNALHDVNQNPEKYAQWAKEKGLIKEGEEEEFKRVAARKEELMKKDQEGKSSEQDKQEFKQIENSRMGSAVSAAQGASYNELQAKNTVNNDAAIQRAVESGTPVRLDAINNTVMAPAPDNHPAPSKSTGSAASLVSSNGFGDSIDLSGSFETAAKGTNVATQQPAAPEVRVAMAGPRPG